MTNQKTTRYASSSSLVNEIQDSIRPVVVALISTIALLGLVTARAEERIFLNAKVNGKAARLFFDSGSQTSALVSKAAKRLGVPTAPIPTNDPGGEVLVGQTSEFTLSLAGTTVSTTFGILDFPSYANLDCDGLIGWPALSENIFDIDAVSRKLTFLWDPPATGRQWTRLPMDTNSATLQLKVPCRDGLAGLLCIDTGDPRGLSLPKTEWHQWKASHPRSPITLEIFFSPPDGAFIYEQAWADEISVGPVVLTGVPVSSAGPDKERRLGTQYLGTLGMAALRRVGFVVDGTKGFAYLKPKRGAAPAYDHNRLAAVFGPTTAKTNQAVAVVVEGGPAYDAGVRNGDVLLQVDDIPVTDWTSNWLNRFRLPAGTKVTLKLERNGRIFSTTATLREVLKPNTAANAN
jgi:hypothetical protein